MSDNYVVDLRIGINNYKQQIQDIVSDSIPMTQELKDVILRSVLSTIVNNLKNNVGSSLVRFELANATINSYPEIIAMGITDTSLNIIFMANRELAFITYDNIFKYMPKEVLNSNIRNIYLTHVGPDYIVITNSVNSNEY